MNLHQVVDRLRDELAAGGRRRARALPIARRLQQVVNAAAARAHASVTAPPRRPPKFLGAADQAQSGNELAGGVHDFVAPVANAILPGSGQVLDTIFSTIAPILDSSLSSFQCKPGNPNYPGCAIPGGSLDALIQSGMPPAQAQQVVDDVIANGPQGGPTGGDPMTRPALRLN